MVVLIVVEGHSGRGSDVQADPVGHAVGMPSKVVIAEPADVSASRGNACRTVEFLEQAIAFTGIHIYQIHVLETVAVPGGTDLIRLVVPYERPLSLGSVEITDISSELVVQTDDPVAVGAEVDDGLVSGGLQLRGARFLDGRGHVDVICPDVQLGGLEVHYGRILRRQAFGHAQKDTRGILGKCRRGILRHAETFVQTVILRDELFDFLDYGSLASLALEQFLIKNHGAMLVPGGVGIRRCEEDELVAGVVEVGKRVEPLAFGEGLPAHFRELVESHFVLRKAVFLVLLEYDCQAVAETVEGVFVDIPQGIAAIGAEIEDHGDLFGLGGRFDGVGDLLLELCLVCDDIPALKAGLECADIRYLAKGQRLEVDDAEAVLGHLVRLFLVYFRLPGSCEGGLDREECPAPVPGKRRRAAALDLEFASRGSLDEHQLGIALLGRDEIGHYTSVIGQGRAGNALPSVIDAVVERLFLCEGVCADQQARPEYQSPFHR